MRPLPRRRDLIVQEFTVLQGEGPTVECLLALVQQKGDLSSENAHTLKTRAWQNLTEGIIERLRVIANDLNPAVEAVPPYMVRRDVLTLIRELEEG